MCWSHGCLSETLWSALRRGVCFHAGSKALVSGAEIWQSQQVMTEAVVRSHPEPQRNDPISGEVEAGCYTVSGTSDQCNYDDTIVCGNQPVCSPCPRIWMRCCIHCTMADVGILDVKNNEIIFCVALVGEKKSHGYNICGLEKYPWPRGRTWCPSDTYF